MLYFRTGKPGHGKTLNTIREVDTEAHKKGRVVYYHNVTGLKPDKLQASWFPFDNPHDWFNLPPNAIIIIDEAQTFFPVRDPRQKVPEYVSRFELIRKAGHEVHLVTQDPRYIDVHLRRLANGHIHYWRVFKSTQVLRFESEAVIEAVEKKSSFKDVDKKVIKLDRTYFDVYDSINADAEHHFKFRPPVKLVLAVLIILGAATYGIKTYFAYSDKGTPTTASTASSSGNLVTQAASAAASVVTRSLNPADSTPKPPSPEETREQYFAQRQPRIANIPSSAPIYDALTQPATYPKLYCLSSQAPDLVERHAVKAEQGTACRCYTQQGTKLDVSVAFCLAVVRDGYFDPARPDRLPTETRPGLAEPATQTAAAQPLQTPTLTVVADSSRGAR